MNLRLSPLTEAKPQEVEALLDSAFGADRHGRTAYRLREGTASLGELSFAAWDGSRLVGSLQSWPVALRTAVHVERLVMVGPVAVLPEAQGQGVGTALMDALIAAAETERADALMMIGDPDYYGRWGFTAEQTGRWRIEAGPYEQHRLLARLRRTVGAQGQLISVRHPELVSR
ncbi:N-acetyltransferase [Sphingomonas sp.]|uniref:GNAT family N-acetyltransferase n=1 Tax=Sphingomonas sp. TaxID=28214 RepID=UPI002DE6D0E2|nr:N-acetyltransferase [Sphingomonas sp.]